MIPRFVAGLALMGGVLVAGQAILPAMAAESTRLVPVSTTDAKTAAPRAVAVLAGGCFWGMEAVFSHVKGVQSVVSGYAGGSATDATYDAVSSEATRHAEAVRITYDPRQVSYATLLRVYFSVAHDPTQLNRQGPDTGTSYRSAIFPQDAEQRRVAQAYIGQLDAAKSWGKPLVTRIEGGRFFPAEAYHQDFAVRNPNHGYIRMWDAPKVAALQKTFPALWTAKPSA
ncbi:MAG: peptide-methionine (S)-S-oxide reductase MsrA [Pseudomonadota bacterium]